MYGLGPEGLNRIRAIRTSDHPVPIFKYMYSRENEQTNREATNNNPKNLKFTS